LKNEENRYNINMKDDNYITDGFALRFIAAAQLMATYRTMHKAEFASKLAKLAVADADALFEEITKPKKDKNEKPTQKQKHRNNHRSDALSSPLE
jgi:hypothetical protein